MSKRNFDPLQLPSRWLYCPRKGDSLIVDKFIAFKVPLSSKFDQNVPVECRFNMAMLIESVKKNFNAKLGLIIDLTNTNRFYDCDTEVKQLGIKYVKIQCRGHGETPSKEQSDLFLRIVEQFIRNNPTQAIGVHCTHGFNRTGFLICSYLVEKLDFSVDMAISLFGQSRPPGIYKQDYINELYRRYSDPSIKPPIAPPLPTWEMKEDKPKSPSSKFASLSDDEDDLEDFSNGKRKKFKSTNHQKRFRQEESKLNPKFADPDLDGVEPCTDQEEILRVRSETQSMCDWKGAGFPGAQPVSMDQNNIKYLYEKKYRVSWKADGTRYLLYINGRDRIYMFDRDNSVFCVRNLSFPYRKDLDKHLTSTLIDGEFVVDQDPISGQKIPRFLIYDIIKFENEEVGKVNFDVRMQCIEKEIIFARQEALKHGKINKQLEPFSIRKKQFYSIIDTKKLLSPDFARQLSHGIDGLIFQPVDEPYKSGRCDLILKWKPPSMNSVDFKLDIVVKEELGGVPEKIGYLYVNGYDQPFSSMRVTRQISNLNGKIIECRWHENRWDFMRERVDKSYPNHYNTAIAVCESIKNPITEEKLIEIVQDIEKRKMPPPFMPSQTSSGYHQHHQHQHQHQHHHQQSY